MNERHICRRHAIYGAIFEIVPVLIARILLERELYPVVLCPLSAYLLRIRVGVAADDRTL